MRYQYCVVGPVATLFPAWSLDRGKHQDEGAGGKEGMRTGERGDENSMMCVFHAERRYDTRHTTLIQTHTHTHTHTHTPRICTQVTVTKSILEQGLVIRYGH